MKKLILASGIFVVFLLEVGFGVYVAFERRYESGLNARNKAIQEVELIPTSDSTAGLPPDDSTVAYLDEPEESVPAAKSYQSIQQSEPRTALPNHTKKRNSPISKVKRSAVAIEPVTITYRVSEPYQFKTREENKIQRTQAKKIAIATAPQKAEPQKKELRKAENKSFIAKTVPIIKKPYDWLKALASKLR